MLKEPPKSYVWQCVSECFTKWFGGWNATNTNITSLYERAIQRLEEFDIVVIQERLHDHAYQIALEAAVNTKIAPITHANAMGGWKFGYEAYNVSSSEIKQLVALNTYDLRLYARFYHQSFKGNLGKF